MGGAAITIALQQLKYVLGIKSFTKKTDIISVMRSVWTSAHHGVLILLSPKEINHLVLYTEFYNETDKELCSICSGIGKLLWLA